MQERRIEHCQQHGVISRGTRLDNVWAGQGRVVRNYAGKPFRQRWLSGKIPYRRDLSRAHVTMKIYLGDGPIMDKESVDSLVDAHVEQHGVNGITWSIVALNLHGNASDIRRQREL